MKFFTKEQKGAFGIPLIVSLFVFAVMWLAIDMSLWISIGISFIVFLVSSLFFSSFENSSKEYKGGKAK